MAAKAANAFNPMLFIQHCFNHWLVLASKDSQHNTPEDVEDTVKAVLNHFKYLAVGQSQLRAIIEKYVKLVTYMYHKVRWLSLSECVKHLISLHPMLCQYFEQQAVDRANRLAVWKKCEDLYKQLSDPSFLLYLFFLEAYLHVISDVNVQCAM